MKKNIEKDFQDFTERHYRKILEIGKRDYKFVFYDDSAPKRPHIILRHDIDFSPHRALKIAEMEREHGIRSTFFVRLHSEFYNLLEKDVFEKIKEIIRMRHRIGLHFEGEFFPKIRNKDDLKEKLLLEKRQVEESFDIKINTFSFHNPNAGNFLRFDQEKIGSMLNAYSRRLKRDYKYCSDSDGYWRHDRILDVISGQKYDRLHILTHPEWWQKRPMSPKDKINRAIGFRSKNQLKSYLNMLRSVGRKDVG